MLGRTGRRRPAGLALVAPAGLCLVALACTGHASSTRTLTPPATATTAALPTTGRPVLPPITASPPGAAQPKVVPTTAPTSVDATPGAFQTPSGNIGCYVSVDAGARCDIADRDWTPPPKPSSCPLDYGQGLFVDSAAYGFVCAGDTARDPSSRTVAYGTAVTQGVYSCDVETSGVTCTDSATGHGFFVAKESYRIF